MSRACIRTASTSANSIGLTIRNNTVIKDPTTKVYKSGWEPVIDVADKSKSVTITGNTAHEVPGPHAGWVISGNKIVPLNYKPGSTDTGGGTGDWHWHWRRHWRRH